MHRHSDFVHLHVHSHYSLLDGAAKIDNLVAAAAEMKMPALALTDHGNMFGAIEFFEKASKKGLQAIVGAEVYMAPNSRFDKDPSSKPYHLVLLARNNDGYKNLMKLVSLAFKEGFYRKPRIDRELLTGCSDGLIGLSACLGGEIPQALIHGNRDKAKEALDYYQKTFGEDRFFLEIQDHGIDDQKLVNPQIIDLAKTAGAPLVVTNDLHYIKKTDAEAQDVLICIQTGKTLDDESRFTFESKEFYLKSPGEMKALFPGVPEAYSNTIKIAEMCHVDISPKKGVYHIPIFEIEEQDKDETSMLRRLCIEAIPERYGKSTPEIDERLNTELKIIADMGFSSYFLIVGDFIAYARKQDIAVGPGRGSAAGSIVAYLLKITNIEPLKYGLFFERFLNPERVSMPDIDIDFCCERRSEVIDYVVEKYGEENVCQIITFGTLTCKAALKDAAKVLNIPFTESIKITKAVPDEIGITLSQALEQSADLRKFESQYSRLFNIASNIEGVIRQTGKHAAGVVIAPDTLYKFIPLSKRGDDVTTQYPMKLVEKLGLLKMDFLGLKTLTVIQRAVRNVRKNRGRIIDIDRIPIDDKRTFKLLCNGDTCGVFQFESSGFTDLMIRMHPTRFEDLIAVIALYRPGPLESGMVDSFVDGKHGRIKIQYPHPDLKELLEETYGVMLYQEQVMKVANILGDFTLGEADKLRRAMGKKDMVEMEAQRSLFVDQSIKNEKLSERLTTQKAGTIFDNIQKFASYGFNKSHSAAYAMVSYQTAWLKANFPQEFMAAMLTNVQGDTAKVSILIEECRKMKIDILPPDVNESDDSFTVVGKAIRFGLGAIKGVGANLVEAIQETRNHIGTFDSIEDFCTHVPSKSTNKKALEGLVKCGAFDSTGYNRAQQLAVIDQAIMSGQEAQKNLNAGQFTLMDFCSSQNIEFDDSKLNYPEIPEFQEREVLNFEKETLGLYLSGHPLFRYAWLLDKIRTTTLAEFDNLPIDSFFQTGGLIKTVARKASKNKNTEFAIVTVEDLTGSYEFLIFDPIFSEQRALLKEDKCVFLAGQALINTRDEDKNIRPMVHSIIELQSIPTNREWQLEVTLNITEQSQSRADAGKLRNIFLAHPGRYPLFINVMADRTSVLLKLGKKYKINPEKGFIEALENLLGDNSVTIKAVPPPPPPKRNGWRG